MSVFLKNPAQKARRDGDREGRGRVSYRERGVRASWFFFLFFWFMVTAGDGKTGAPDSDSGLEKRNVYTDKIALQGGAG